MFNSSAFCNVLIFHIKQLKNVENYVLISSWTWKLWRKPSFWSETLCLNDEYLAFTLFDYYQGQKVVTILLWGCLIGRSPLLLMKGRTIWHPWLTRDPNPGPFAQEPASLATSPLSRRLLKAFANYDLPEFLKMYSRSNKKRNTPIYFNINYRTEMKLVPIIMD